MWHPNTDLSWHLACLIVDKLTLIRYTEVAGHCFTRPWSLVRHEAIITVGSGRLGGVYATI